MDFFWIYDLSNWEMGCMIVGVFVSLSLLGLWLSRLCCAPVEERERARHNDLVRYYVSAIASIYGITIGLLAAGTWHTYSEVVASTVAEASSLAALYRDVSSIQPPAREELQQALIKHTRFEIEQQWAAQQKGYVLPNDELTTFQNKLLRVQPRNDSEKIIFSEAFSQFNHYVEQRRVRLAHASSGLPATLWQVVMIGAALTIGVTWFFQVPSFRLHAALTTILSSLIGLLVFVTAAMDWPYRGAFSVAPDALLDVLQSLMSNTRIGAETG